jgi:histidine triad (HIT) family protein
MSECIFCALQHSESAVLAANELAYAVLDLAPIRPGHALVIPRQHVEDFFELDEEVQAAMLRLANGLAKALQEVCQPQRVGMLVAGFDVAHAHLHVVPIQDAHDITSKVVLDGRKVMAADDELQEMRTKLAARIIGQVH